MSVYIQSNVRNNQESNKLAENKEIKIVENSNENTRKLSKIGIKNIELKFDHFDHFIDLIFDFFPVKWSKILLKKENCQTLE